MNVRVTAAEDSGEAARQFQLINIGVSAYQNLMGITKLHNYELSLSW